MQTPLVDSEGYPKADIDVYSIRNARAALIRLYNDLEGKRNEIQDALILVHQCNHEVTSCDVLEDSKNRVFARITRVAPDSPADLAGLKRSDLIMEFGNVVYSSSNTSILQEIASELSNSNGVLLIINIHIPFKVFLVS